MAFILLGVVIIGDFARAEVLRGFGDVKMTSAQAGKLSGYQFECESADKAKLLAHKVGRDLAQSATGSVAWADVVIGGVKAKVLVRSGLGSYLIAYKDRSVWVWSSTEGDHEKVAGAFSDVAAQVKDASFFDPGFVYPVFYDKFSHYGIGSWYPSYWTQNLKEFPNEVDDHLRYAKKYDLTLQPNNGGLLLRNLLPKIHEYNRPYHFAQWQEWSQELARLAPEELVQPNDQFTTMASYYGQVSEGGRKLLQYRNWVFQTMMKNHVEDPLLLDWLDPNGEVGPFSNFAYWDFSENNRTNLVRFLQTERKYTLESLGEAWYGSKRRFKSWEQVQIPMSYEFYGWSEGDPLASKTWRIHPADEQKDDKQLAWYELSSDCPAYIRNGIAKGYLTENFKDDGWASFDLGGELGAIHLRTSSKHFWYRGSIDVSAKWLKQARKKDGRVYMTVAALTVSSGWKNPDRLWINGKEISSLYVSPGADLVAQVDVTEFIREGRNSIVFLPSKMQAGISGPFFLTTKQREEFPFADTKLNARFTDWRDYISWCVMEKMEETFKAIRAVDKDRFIKMHAAEDKHLGVPLQAKYGCFGHNTGEGGFFRPWDKRFGYPYGIPASAEFGGGIVTNDGIRRWIGWFTFEGLNVFDNFHNIQEMMYSPSKDAWIEYMPYLKLAARRDIKRPDIALIWSAHNNHLLPRPVAYCFDLGRGDLQSIGYSYVDANESTIRDGKVKDYPVWWDSGTWIMAPETVKQIKEYVEAGGTFVALQETGRHTFTQRDAWPISELTGFKVREIRPMTGALTILVDQPIFKKLAGKTFYNRGKSIDFSDYNYADKCIALDPVAAGTIPLARYEDGSIAIGMRKLGKGRVIVLGSPFWRDSYDGAGMWWPGESQSQFLEDILDGIGIKPLAKSDSHDIWREHYIANNGTEEYLALFNPFKEPKTFTIEWNTVKPVSSLHDPKDGKKIDGKIEGNVVKLEKVTLQGLETRIVAGQIVQPPQDAVASWYKQLGHWWRPSAPGVKIDRPDLPIYDISLADKMTGKIVTGAEVAKVNPAEISASPTVDDSWKLWVGQSVEELKNKPDATRKVFLHGALELPKSWKPTDKIELVVGALGYGGLGELIGPVDIWLNGQQLASQQKCVAPGYGKLDSDGWAIDATKLLKFNAPNVVTIVAGKNGFVGEVNFRRRPQVAAEVEVKGEFKVQLDADGGIGKATLPGVMKGLYGWKEDVLVPADWKGSRVFITIEPDKFSDYDSFAINNKVVFHPIRWYRAVTWMDITPWVKFGAPNKLTLISRGGTGEWKPSSINYKSIKLQQVKER